MEPDHFKPEAEWTALARPEMEAVGGMADADGEELAPANTGTPMALLSEENFNPGYAAANYADTFDDDCAQAWHETVKAMGVATQALIEGAFALSGDAMKWWNQTASLMMNGSTGPWLEWASQLLAGCMAMQESMIKLSLQPLQRVPRIADQLAEQRASMMPFAWMWNSCEAGMDVLLGMTGQSAKAETEKLVRVTAEAA